MPSSTYPRRDVSAPIAGRLKSLGYGLRKKPGALVALFTFLAVCADSALAPELNTVAPMVSSGLFLILMFRRGSGVFDSGRIEPRIASVTTRRVLFFAAIHLAIITASLKSGHWQDNHSAVVSLFLSASKYLILLPTAVLLPPASWLDFGRVYRAEWVAAAIALTFYPYRIFTMAWPWYGQVLGHSVYLLSHPFVSSIHYAPTLNPTLQGPHLDLTIVFGCGGLQGIRLFQVLFMLVVIVDWGALNRRRAVAAYFGGLLAMLMTNVLRIALLFVLGNTGLQNRVIEYHLTAGWVLFTLAFIAYLFTVYRWLLTPGKGTPANSVGIPATAPHGMVQRQNEQ